ncbi:MAG: hypothetical protein OXT67_12670 [Zetaproteobacteria bacterium]|nr:hypothetical protein [Zetaproteobacteria bacterium]
MKALQIYNYKLFFAIFSLLTPTWSVYGTSNLCNPQLKIWEVASVLWQQQIFTPDSNITFFSQPPPPPKSSRHLEGHCAPHSPPKATWQVTQSQHCIVDYRIRNNKLDLQLNHKNCKEFKLSWAANDLSHATELSLDQVSYTFSLQKFSKGFLGLYAVDRKRRNLGMQTIFLMPTAAPESITIPLRFAIRPHQSLISWVQSLRQQAGLQALTPISDDIHPKLQPLLHSFSFHHNKRTMTKVGRQLHRVQLNPIGENRAIGQSIQEIAWQFWSSPQHRALLLHPRARKVAVLSRHVKRQFLASISLFY